MNKLPGLNQSKLRFYSYAVCVEDREITDDQYGDGVPIEDMFQSNREAYFTPIEVTPYIDKELKKKEEELKAKGKDADDETYNIKLKVVNEIPADYLPFHGEPNSIPHLKKGETVMLWQYADEDRYYWTFTGTHQHLRRMDHYGLYVAATKKASETLTLGKNVYSGEVSPTKKRIEFRTTTANKEPVILNCLLNSKTGETEIGDVAGNRHMTKFKGSIALMRNASGAMIIVKGNTAMISTGGPEIIEAGSGKINIEAPNVTTTGPTNLNGPVTILGCHIDAYIKAICAGSAPPINPALGILSGGKNAGGYEEVRVQGKPSPGTGKPPTGTDLGGGGQSSPSPLDGGGSSTNSNTMSPSAPTDAIGENTDTPSAPSVGGAPNPNSLNSVAPSTPSSKLKDRLKEQKDKIKTQSPNIGVDRTPNMGSLDKVHDRLNKLKDDTVMEEARKSAQLDRKIGTGYRKAVRLSKTISDNLKGMPGDHERILEGAYDPGKPVPGSDAIDDLLPGYNPMG